VTLYEDKGNQNNLLKACLQRTSDIILVRKVCISEELLSHRIDCVDIDFFTDKRLANHVFYVDLKSMILVTRPNCAYAFVV
jgi:hypothetical protein